jgi:hypothetical protein
MNQQLVISLTSANILLDAQVLRNMGIPINPKIGRFGCDLRSGIWIINGVQGYEAAIPWLSHPSVMTEIQYFLLNN